MNVNDAGLSLIAEFEGFSPYLYNDPVGHATVGYGLLIHMGNYHRNRGECAKCDKWARQWERNHWLTAQQGRDLLREMVRAYADAVAHNTRDLNENEFAALVSLCYNIGPGGYANSTVCRAVNAGMNPCPELKKYVKGTNGIIYAGLVRRREAECRLFHTPVEEDDMIIAACGDSPTGYRIYFLGDLPPRWVLSANEADALIAVHGQPKALPWARLWSLGAR